VFLLFAPGCVSLETQEEISLTDIKIPPISREREHGVYHKVGEGETLWRIAKTYDVAIGNIIRINNIPKAAKIEHNQLLFIPGADAIRAIVLDTDESQAEFIWPIKGKIIKYFHQRQKNGEIHKGISIQAQEGDTVRAARTGRVVFADYLSGYGQTVILDHLDGLYSVYARNAKLLVKLNELVLKSSGVAEVGASDHLAYLHFEIRKNSVEDNPLYYLP